MPKVWAVVVLQGVNARAKDSGQAALFSTVWLRESGACWAMLSAMPW